MPRFDKNKKPQEESFREMADRHGLAFSKGLNRQMKRQAEERQNKSADLAKATPVNSRVENAKETAKKWVKTWTGIIFLVLLIQFFSYIKNGQGPISGGIITLVATLLFYVLLVATLGFVVGLFRINNRSDKNQKPESARQIADRHALAASKGLNRQMKRQAEARVPNQILSKKQPLTPPQETEESLKEMSHEEIRIRAEYAYTGALLFCRPVFEKSKAIMQESISQPWKREWDRKLMNEAGSLAAFLTTREVWEHAVENEQTAEAVNQLILEFFEKTLRVSAINVSPYATASQSDAWIHLYGNKVTAIFGLEDAVLGFELNGVFVAHFEDLMRTTKDAFHLPLTEIKSRLAKALEDNLNRSRQSRQAMRLSPDETEKAAETIESFIANGESAEEPRFVIVTGGVGAGKTTMRREKYADGFVHCDYGDIFTAIRKVIAGSDEKIDVCARVALRRILERCIRSKKNIVTEVIGDDQASLELLINKMVTEGYKVEISHVHADPVEAYKRHLKAVESDEDYISAHFTQEATLNAFYQRLGLEKSPTIPED